MLWLVWNQGFHLTRQDTPGKQYAATAAQAFDANISPQADDLPLVTAAWMGLAQTDAIFQA